MRFVVYGYSQTATGCGWNGSRTCLGLGGEPFDEAIFTAFFPPHTALAGPLLVATSMTMRTIEIWVIIHTYKSYGGHATLSLIGRYFQSGLPPLGAAIKEIGVHVYFRSSTGPKATLESLYTRYDRFLEGLPTSKFFRKKLKVEISFISKLGGSDVVAGYGPPKLDLFLAGAHEIAGQFEVLREKLKPSNEFDLEAFFKAIQRKLDAIPKNAEELDALKAALDAEGKMERESMDEWEKLGIDWEDYHPKCRAILDNPFFWNCTDDFSPNGNDTGADVLALYAEWRKRSPKSPAVPFLEQLMRDWGMPNPPPTDDDTLNATWEEAKIGLAFAQLKIDGLCEEPVRELALDALSHCRRRMHESHREWALLDERLRTIEMMESKLRDRSKEVSPAG